jgi:hypothetical protein
MPDAAKTPSPEADPGKYESGELTPEERQHEQADEDAKK